MTLSTSFSVTYANGAGVRDVRLSCASGEVLALIGESGSGKTTIAHALLGLLPGSAKIEGTAIANGVEILRAPARLRRELLRKSIGYIPQDASACFSPYVCLGKQFWRFWTVRTGRNDRARFHDRATTCLRSVHLDPEVMKRYPQQLSVGQIQRAAIANAIMTEPELLIADEPTSALDAVTGAEVLALLGREALRGTSVLLVTHDLGASLRLARNAAVLRSGIIVETGPVSTITTAPSHPYTRSLLAAAAWDRSPAGQRSESSHTEAVCLAANENRERRSGRNGNS